MYGMSRTKQVWMVPSMSRMYGVWISRTPVLFYLFYEYLVHATSSVCAPILPALAGADRVLVLPLLHLPLQVFWVGELCFVIICRFKGCWQTFELILDGVEHNSGEGERPFPFIFRREFRVAFLQGENHVCIRFTVVRLHQRFPENGLDDTLKLCCLLQLNVCQFFHNCVQVLGANLVQQSTDIPVQRLHWASRLCDSISLLWLFQDGWIPLRPSDFTVVGWPWIWTPRALSNTQAQHCRMDFAALQPPNSQHQLLVVDLVRWSQLLLHLVLLGRSWDLIEDIGDQSGLCHQLLEVLVLVVLLVSLWSCLWFWCVLQLEGFLWSLWSWKSWWRRAGRWTLGGLGWCLRSKGWGRWRKLAPWTWSCVRTQGFQVQGRNEGRWSWGTGCWILWQSPSGNLRLPGLCHCSACLLRSWTCSIRNCGSGFLSELLVFNPAANK